MTKARRRVVRLALMLKVAGIEPVFAGCNYREMQAAMEMQLSGLTPSRRKAVRRQALRLISEAQGLERAADHLVPRPLQRGSMGRDPSIEHPPKQMRCLPPAASRCSVCRMRFGFKRSYSSRSIAQRVCDRQNDVRLAVYPCPAGTGYHLGHLPDTRAATADHSASTPQQREPHRVDAPVPPMLSTPLHKESPMKMQATLGNPILIMVYSTALLFIGCAVGMHWAHTPATALWLCIAGGLLMAVHDTATGVLWFWLTARWAHSVIQRKDR